jgi:uncharacterized protein (DUF1778 family)
MTDDRDEKCNDNVSAPCYNMINKEAGGSFMATLRDGAARRETLNIRIKPEDRTLIDRAAKLRRKNRTDFILDAVRAAAEEALYDQALIMVDPETYAKFLVQLDMPPRPNERLQKTMQTPAPWGKA